MTYRRAVIPALVGGLLITLLLWWAGASTHALQLRGTTSVFDPQSVIELERWLTPWAYDSTAELMSGGPVGGSTVMGGETQYADLYSTAMQIRFVAVFVLFLAGALLLVRRIPPTRGRTCGHAARPVGVGPGGRNAGSDPLRTVADRVEGARQLPGPRRHWRV